ncbi:MAG: hypothetical protein AAGJ40_09230 [Planctomycetota bacterium]
MTDDENQLHPTPSRSSGYTGQVLLLDRPRDGSKPRMKAAVDLNGMIASGEEIERCSYVSSEDFREVYANVKDRPKNGVYIDYVWPGVGVTYSEDGNGSEQDHRDLAALNSSFEQTKVVVRYNDHELIRELYPEADWSWYRTSTRNQAGSKINEVLIVRKV